MGHFRTLVGRVQGARWAWLAVVVACSAGAPAAHALTEQELENGAFESEVMPYYYSARRLGTFTGERGKQLSYVTFERTDEEGALVLLPGRGGSHIWMGELIYDLRDSGWSIYVMDHRGQGFSERLLDNPRKGHVEDWDNYSKDVKTFMDRVVNTRPHARTVVLGISMGGAIATTFAQQYPDDVDALVLVVPMHKPNYRPFTEGIAGVLGEFGAATMQLDEYGPTQGDPTPLEEQKFEENRGMRSRVRWEKSRDISRQHQDLLLGGVTYGWAREVVHANRVMRTLAVRMTQPILLLQAGEDAVVQNDGQDAFCQRARGCVKRVYPTSRHGMLEETDDIRGPALHEIRSFLDTQSSVGCSAAAPGAWAPWALVLVWVARRRGRNTVR